MMMTWKHLPGLVAGIPFAVLALAPGAAAQWRSEHIPLAARVIAIETVEDEPLVQTPRGWHRLLMTKDRVTVTHASARLKLPLVEDALPDGRVVTGRRDIARAWLADQTKRYDHGVLGDQVEAGSLVVERRDGTHDVVRLGPDAVFEDLHPRVVDLDGDGIEEVIVVKSYLARGSALAVIGLRDGRRQIIAETPPIGRPHAWLNPAGIADFDGDGVMDITLVRMPHALGRLELWSWRGGRLEKKMEITDAANHFIGSRALQMSAAADFDGDGILDLAIPSFDRSSLRIIAFAPHAREIARVPLPAKAATNFGLVKDASGRPAVIVGLADGSLVMLRR